MRTYVAVITAAMLVSCSPSTNSGGPLALTATNPTIPVGQSTVNATGTTRHGPGTAAVPSRRNPTLGIGTDESFPNLGSSAYDARNYSLELKYNPDSNDLDAHATIDAVSNRALGEISFDFDGLKVSSVSVDGDGAAYSIGDRKLKVTPATRIESGRNFTVVVAYSGRPKPRASDAVSGVEMGWHGGGGGSFVVSEPDAASTWYPVNNHPLDKATYSIAVTVPKPYSAIANGRLDQTDDHGLDRTFHWVMDKPMTSYLATVVTGEYVEALGGTIDGVAYSTWAPSGYKTPKSIVGSSAVATLSERLGPFPFPTYGGVIYPASFIHGDIQTRQFLSGVALEVQGRSLYSENAVGRTTVLHETAHQWMGDNVSLSDWSKDIWWVEGFAHFAETAFDDPPQGRSAYQSIREKCKGRTPGDLAKSELFSDGSYVCGALVFYALQHTVGDDTFWKILRTFNERFHYSNATTDDLIATANETAGRDLSGFFHDWLFGPLPALPGDGAR